MPAAPVVALAVSILLVVVVALCQEVLAIRAIRRELDSYLRWLLEDAAGPVSVARPESWS